MRASYQGCASQGLEPLASTDDFSVVAIISAFNEEDIIVPVVENLLDEGVHVYLLDNHSTDDTAEALRPLLGRGLLHIEQFPSAEIQKGSFPWGQILERKAELALDIDANWFIHHDADEFGESPWQGVGLREGIRLVDRMGYSAIDFRVLDFMPVDDSFQKGKDPREVINRFLPGEVFSRPQVKCWKKLPGVRVDLASSGGSDVQFPARDVFPIRFLMRHYPIRGQRHGQRKMIRERLPRILAEEKNAGWHGHFEHASGNFLRSVESLIPFDPLQVAVDLQIHHRDFQSLRKSHDDLLARAATLERERASMAQDEPKAHTSFSRELANAYREAREYRVRLDEQALRASEAIKEKTQLEGDIATLLARMARERSGFLAERGALEKEARAAEQSRDEVLAELTTCKLQLEQILSSRTWRFSRPFRSLASLARRIVRGNTAAAR